MIFRLNSRSTQNPTFYTPISKKMFTTWLQSLSARLKSGVISVTMLAVFQIKNTIKKPYDKSKSSLGLLFLRQDRIIVFTSFLITNYKNNNIGERKNGLWKSWSLKWLILLKNCVKLGPKFLNSENRWVNLVLWKWFLTL